MRSLFKSTIFVPDCNKSVGKSIHIDTKKLKPTKIEYELHCSEGKRNVTLMTFGYENVSASGCTGCPHLLKNRESY